MVSVDGVLSRPRKGWTCFTQALPQTGRASIHGDSGKKRAAFELKGRPGDVPWVVQLSDLHFSVHHPKRALDFKAIVGPTLAMVKPSLVFITGDLTDGKCKDLLTMKQDEAGWVEYHKVIDDAIKRSGLKRSSFYDLRGNHDSFGVPNTDGSFDFYSKYSINAQLGRKGSISSVTVQAFQRSLAFYWEIKKPHVFSHIYLHILGVQIPLIPERFTYILNFLSSVFRSFGNNLTTYELKLTMEDGARLWKIDCGSICVFVAVPLSPSPRYVYHAAGIAKHGEIDYEAVNLAEGFNGADLRNVCTETGMSAIRAERDYVIHEDFMKVVRKLNGAKKLESSAHYNADFGKV